MRLRGLAFGVAAAFLLTACDGAEGPSAQAKDLPPSDPYVHALHAVMNYGACRFVRPERNLAAAEKSRRNEAVAGAERHLARIENLARADGHEAYIDLGRRTFGSRVQQELHAGCYPSESEARKAARDALELFSAHIAAMSSIG